MSTSAPAPDPVAARVYYSGRVQGVGFRATAAWIARSRPVTGWVKNLPDGRVELFAEGHRAEVQDFLAEVARHFAGKIHGQSVGWEPATGAFASFEVVR